MLLALSALVAVPVVAADDGAGGRVDYHLVEVRPGAEVKQPSRSVQAARGRVERAGDALGAQPVVLDELDHRGRVGAVAADVVVPRVRRDHHHGQPLAVTAAATTAADGYRGLLAAGSVDRGVVGPVDQLGRDVVIPAVGVVIRDDDRGRGPVLGLLDLVDLV